MSNKAFLETMTITGDHVPIDSQPMLLNHNTFERMGGKLSDEDRDACNKYSNLIIEVYQGEYKVVRIPD